jgi:hypothetical protein
MRFGNLQRRHGNQRLYRDFAMFAESLLFFHHEEHEKEEREKGRGGEPVLLVACLCYRSADLTYCSFLRLCTANRYAENLYSLLGICGATRAGERQSPCLGAPVQGQQGLALLMGYLWGGVSKREVCTSCKGSSILFHAQAKAQWRSVNVEPVSVASYHVTCNARCGCSTLPDGRVSASDCASRCAAHSLTVGFAPSWALPDQRKFSIIIKSLPRWVTSGSNNDLPFGERVIPETLLRR